MEKESFRAKIKTLRKSKGWSQEQLAQQSALSLRTVPRIEKGVTIPYRDSLLKLSEALGIHIEDMMREEPTEKPDDNDYMVAMHLSFLCFLYHPLLGLVLPFFMGMMKRGKNPCVDQSGKKLMGFQLIWLIVLYMLQLLVTKGRYV
jgi:transcriptional regulator with XRE-family HTH domain